MQVNIRRYGQEEKDSFHFVDKLCINRQFHIEMSHYATMGGGSRVSFLNHIGPCDKKCNNGEEYSNELFLNKLDPGTERVFNEISIDDVSIKENQLLITIAFPLGKCL